MSKRELVLNAFDNKPVERVPVGFWFHFASDIETFEGLINPTIIKSNINGHQRFFDQFNPDFLKLMSDGYFLYPFSEQIDLNNASEYKNLHPVGGDHIWIKKQIELVSELVTRFGSEVTTFYNIFAPLTYLKFALQYHGSNISKIFEQDYGAVYHAVNVVAEDVSILASRIIKDGKADGIYFSVQNLSELPRDKYLKYVAPGEKAVLKAANSASDYNILHVCGFEGFRNDVTTYADYEAKAVNWAVAVEGLSLKEGKELFGGRAVIGGFDNKTGGLLHKGKKEEMEAYTQALIEDVGTRGVIIGADCTVPRDIDWDRLNWVRDKAAQISKNT